MLMSSTSPQICAATNRYNVNRKSPYSFRASIRRSPSTSGSASPSAARPRAPPIAFRSPKRPTADAGTQYTPPGSPPTKRRFVSPPAGPPAPQASAPVEQESTIAEQQLSPAPPAAHDAPTEPPPEPQVRETPRTTLGVSSAENSRSVSPSAPGSARHHAKRQRQSDQEVKILPTDYAQCEPKSLATLIAALLMNLIGHNDNIKLEEVHLTRFHSRTPPGISVHDYMQRLTFHATLPTPVLLAMVNYIDKLCEAYPVFLINSLTVHRFLIAAATVAAKGLCDVFWTNSTYAKVGGVSKKELALLELELLTKIEWRIVPDPDQLGEYYRNLIRDNPEFALDGHESSDIPSSASDDSIGTDTMDTE